MLRIIFFISTLISFPAQKQYENLRKRLSLLKPGRDKCIGSIPGPRDAIKKKIKKLIKKS